MSDLFDLEDNGVEAKLTIKYGGAYDAPWLVLKGDLTEIAKKIGFTEDRDAKASDVIKLSGPVARYAQQQWSALDPKAR